MYWLSVRSLIGSYFYLVRPFLIDNQAGNYGTGSRGGGVSALICAVIDDRGPNADAEDKKFVII